ncbi:MAG: protein SanA [Candidatus Magasanikbacteria bacterium CG_4_10_14_0_2_um_filter_33_14]|uniref:Protein SanA n=1 Tax=Candidatus Magasanikbacteria bacterium CG_4_10_14_0_2_um_filter_33_14 TaxID=1974636 RepID=A0A2M7VAK9_9BACT|nr:MAG: protein SanA [Candidatus Magasanikbacteria bacterium CG_4_10_14_0_2_um_filter_33_14]
MKKVFKRIFLIFLFSLAITSIWIIVTDSIVTKTASKKIYDSLENIPYNKVGLLLGTSKYLRDGRENAYYRYRINAAEELLNAHKIDFILVSGDNGTIHYDEPTSIKNDLIADGVTSSSIYLDYAGFRTLDSVVRSKEIFGQESITVISQKFHNERAIYIANKKSIEAIGYNAKDVSTYYSLGVQIREKLARVKMMLDLAFHKQPKFLGEKITIE